MSRRSRKPRLPGYPVRVTIESLTHDGRGVAHVDGKATFVDNALPGEECSFMYTGKSRRHDEGKLCELFTASTDRVEPICSFFTLCGGCSLQHLDAQAQIIYKQQTLLDNLERIGKVEPAEVLAPLTGPVRGYRNKARLGVKDVHKKGRVLVGFREKRKSYLADINRCEVLHPSVGERLEELARMIEGLEARARIAQIEVAVGENATVLVFRNLDPLTASDHQKLVEYAKQSGLHLYQQPGGPDTVQPLWPEQSQLQYRLPEYDLDIRFLPTDFTQVNADINRAMIGQALTLLELTATDQVLDLFCGLGNFTLPIARHVAQVTGVEGDEALVQRARDNAAHNGIENAEFFAVDLTTDIEQQPWMNRVYDKILLDPPRSGALEMIQKTGALGANRIVYVSCHPASLARDAEVLVHQHGYTLVSAGVMDMFPHTSHVESMALFVKSG